MSERDANRCEPGTSAPPLIYMVDDEPMVLELARTILEPLGYEMETFRDPEAALEAFNAARRRPALLITDYSMRQMDGLALIDACRRLEPAQRTLLISGTVGPEILHQGVAKPDRFLGKPYHAKQLLDLVKSMVAD